jgi:hypothetical protein
MSPVAVLERHPRLLLQVQNRAGLSRPRHWPICDVPMHTKYLYHATTLESSCEEKTFLVAPCVTGNLAFIGVVFTHRMRQPREPRH